MTVVAAKSALRAQALALRAAVPEALRHVFAERLADIGPGLVRDTLAQQRLDAAVPVVSVYHPIRDEADPLPLLRSLALQGIATALPVTVGRGQPLLFHLWRGGDPLRRGAMGIAEPLAEAPLAEPDILFVPLAAFDARGFRLGYGAGHYDTTLARLRRTKRILAIGIAFAVQEVGRVPTEPHDEALDGVATENALLMFDRA